MNIKKIFGLAALSILIGVNVSVYAGLKDNPPKEPQGEGGGGTTANMYCPIWNVTYEIGGGALSFPKVICTTGGKYKCQEGTCPKN